MATKDRKKHKGSYKYDFFYAFLAFFRGNRPLFGGMREFRAGTGLFLFFEGVT
jgi:hypothetical protein